MDYGMWNDRTNMSMLTDFYELTMMQGYFKNKEENSMVIFDAFFRNNPFGGGYSIMCGIEQLVKYIKELHFSDQDVEYLRGLGIFEEDFLAYLADFHFTGSVYAIPEGSLMFPREPMVKVIAPIMEAQLVETAILNIINHQSLIATKAARICYAARGDGIMEFGLRRAQGPDAGTYGARAAVIAGCVGTLAASILLARRCGIAVSSARGILFKNGSAMEKISNMKVVATGKTGILTDGQYGLQRVIPAIAFEDEEGSEGRDQGAGNENDGAGTTGGKREASEEGDRPYPAVL